ncbi:MAG: S41 family peptidase [Bacteroidales bacterium]
MKRLLTLALIVGVLALAGAATAAPIKFARYPHVANGKMVFSYHNDIWIANEDGTSPVRLSAHVARDTYPRLSPDGKWVAFSSNRMGNDDVYVMPVGGGEPRQLTFNTTPDTVLYWTPDGKRIIFSSSLGARPFGSPLYSVSVDGGIPEPLDMDVARYGMIKQDGSMIAFNRMAPSYWRKGYKGNAADSIWVQDLKTKAITRLTNSDPKTFRDRRHDQMPMWGADGMIYFLSERTGVFNIWKVSPKGGQPTQVTFDKDDGIQYPSISPDGKTIAYESGFELWTLKVPEGKPKQVAVDMAFDPKLNLVDVLNSKGKPDAFHPSPDGDYVAVDYHGEIFIVPSDPEVGEKHQVTSSSWRDRRERYSPGGKYIAYTSDESKEEEIWIYDVAAGTRKKLTTHASFKDGFDWAPDSKHLVWSASNHLYLSDVEATTPPVDLATTPGGYRVSGFSPDSKWIVYSRQDAAQNNDVYLFEVATKKEYNVTKNPFRDSSAVITPDNKKVVFLSDRDGSSQIYVVVLERMKEDPDDPLVRERIKKATPPQRPGGGQGGAAREAREAEPPAALKIDLEGIERRAVQITKDAPAPAGGGRGGTPPAAARGAGINSFFLSSDGKTVYFVSSDDRGRGLFAIGIDGKDRRRLTDGAFQGLAPTQDRRKVFYTQDGDLYQMEMSGQYRKTKVNFTLNVTVDKRTEWAQMLDECWRVMRYRFYDEKMHGVDWAAIKAKYEPLLRYVGENQDVYDLANEMIGELNASHTGVNGPPSQEMPQLYTAKYLGFELASENGAYRISHVYRDGPADKEWLGVKEGEYVVAIDGHKVKAGDNYWQILNEAINDYVPVKLAATPTDPNPREVRIKTVASLGDIKYQEWVKRNHDFVDKESGGKIAYVHIRAMDQPSLARFQQDIDEHWNAQGIIVDIRYNGGGNIDQELLDILERRPYEYWNSRGGDPLWGRRPRQAIAGPKVMLINWRSASDSEVTPLGFRDLKLGTIVGTPTNGSVTATGSYALINGGSIRTPGGRVVSYDPNKPNNWGIALENYGVAPDVWVENTPEDELKGFDRELKTAVDEALKMLKTGKYQWTPPTAPNH